MSKESDDTQWKEIVAVGFLFLCVCFGFAACDLTAHYIKTSGKAVEAKAVEAKPTKRKPPPPFT